jgi:predicted transposase YbfD/YdcC
VITTQQGGAMLSETFLKHFQDMKDPRINNHNYRHELMDILVITILGMICGADVWTEICEFAEAKEEWLKTFLKLPHGIPSHDTLGRVFSLLNPEVFEECFLNWINSLAIDVEKEIIAIDGKTLKGSHHRRKGKSPLHLVSAWAVDHRVMLGQVKTEEKSNEIEAIPRLLQMIDVKESIVTIDAMGCQQEIAKQIISQEGNYVLSLKENQGTLYEDVVSIFAKGEERQFKKMLNRRKVEKIHDHGRVETRRYTLVSARDPLLFSLRWPGLKGIGMLEVTRTVNNEVERSKRYFLTSLEYEQIDDFMRAVRGHWQIEINLHWSLDVSFREDLNRVRAGHAAENLAIVRRIALNLLKQEKTRKIGITAKRKKAGWSNQYLLKILKADTNLIAGKKEANVCEI